MVVNGRIKDNLKKRKESQEEKQKQEEEKVEVDKDITKEEISKLLNEIFQSNIDWTKLPKGDLEQIINKLVNNPVDIGERIIKFKVEDKTNRVSKLLDTIRNEGVTGFAKTSLKQRAKNLMS